ncbi:MAG: MBL fold metallo-hydrolase [Planctomycetaceae bacterium]|jgi:phosphoribosyl 1,2-cyclic phosphodiesterase|nr:MBL fold metallo-hydrolase [Planctomycetaceae bacterium]
MRFISLQSGSSGNCLFVESGETRLLFDAGLTGAQTEQRLAALGIDINTIEAVILSHSHCDHTKGAGVLLRKYARPLWMTGGTYHHILAMRKVGQIGTPHFFRPEATLQFGSLTIETIPTMHDAPEGVCFVVDDGKKRLGIMTDLGCRFGALKEAITTLDGILIESDYDPVMLKNGPYDKSLQDRIRGSKGHLSNRECAELLRDAGRKLRWACLGHLSGNNNTPELALETHRQILGRKLPLYVASRRETSPVLEL